MNLRLPAVVVTVAAALAPLGVADAAESGIPQAILGHIAGLKGLCLDLSCGLGKLAASIAAGSDLFVVALAKDEKDCAAAREALDKAGLYGRRATVVVGSAIINIVRSCHEDSMDSEETVRQVSEFVTELASGCTSRE